MALLSLDTLDRMSPRAAAALSRDDHRAEAPEPYGGIVLRSTSPCLAMKRREASTGACSRPIAPETHLPAGGRVESYFRLVARKR